MRVEVKEDSRAGLCTAVSGSIREVEVVDSTFYFIEVLGVGGGKNE